MPVEVKRIDELHALAERREKGDLIDKLGALAIYAAMADFWIVQAAKLAERMTVQGRLATGQNPGIEMHDDEWFFRNQIRSRKIISEIKRLTPTLKAIDPKEQGLIDRLSELGLEFVSKSDTFLNHRNLVLHHLVMMKNQEEVTVRADLALESYHELTEAHAQFMLSAVK